MNVKMTPGINTITTGKVKETNQKRLIAMIAIINGTSNFIFIYDIIFKDGSGWEMIPKGVY